MSILLSTIEPLLVSFMLVLVRVTGLFVAIPFLGTKFVPSKIKIAVVLSISFLLIITIDNKVNVNAILSLQMILLLTWQFLIGLAIGLLFNTILQIMILAGEMIAMQAGLGMAIMNDPTSNSSIPIVAEVYYFMSLLFFFSLDIHLEIIDFLATTFKEIPLNSNTFTLEFFYNYALLGSMLYAVAFKIALPIVSVILLLQFALGIMTKAAPQLNIFSIGFPLMIMLGLILLGLNLTSLKYHFVALINHGFDFLRQYLLVDN